MTGFEHTFVALVCIGAAFYFGRFVGKAYAYSDGFEDGVYASTDAILTQLGKQYGMNFKADVHIESNSEEDE